MGPGGENGPSDARGDGEVDDLGDRSSGREEASTSRNLAVSTLWLVLCCVSACVLLGLVC